jgi:hypothetical protein
MLKFDAKPCFVRGGVGMRELQLEGFTAAAGEGPEVEVMYKGPFREVRGDDGQVFSRGRRVAVPAVAAERLRAGDLASQFVVFGPTPARPATVTACGN